MASRTEVRVPLDLWPRRGGWKGKVVKVYKSVGERVSKGEVIAEIEIEKAVLEIESPTDGVLVEVASEGEEVSPESIIARIEGG
ncbi:MAG: lipoyl domain-containing protein [Aeropyrum sp.]|nr:lipoyl domain-containing protein [Aeropyrum sp.]